MSPSLGRALGSLSLTDASPVGWPTTGEAAGAGKWCHVLPRRNHAERGSPDGERFSARSRAGNRSGVSGGPVPSSGAAPGGECPWLGRLGRRMKMTTRAWATLICHSAKWACTDFLRVGNY